MTTEPETLCRHRVFHHFYQICRIPHGSGNEKALSDYLVSWAAELGLYAEQDAWNNVLIRKPAAPGYEDSPGVMLQAHIDMVCEKSDSAEHDFAKDPICWVIDGDTLSTGGRTTLGADDGIGMALIMAVLEDRTLKHPALEALFTTMEEEDLSGAEHFDASKMQSHYLINLDHTVEHEINCGSCGGMQVDFRLPLPVSPVPAGFHTYRLSVSGLKGGHSGDDINKGRGNANVVLTRLLVAIEDCTPYLLGQIRGGSFRLAIPRSAEAILCLDPAAFPAVRTVLERLTAEMQKELAVTADRLTVAMEPAEPILQGTDPAPVLSALMLIPDGIFQMNEMLAGLVDTSDNLGEIYLEDGMLHLVLEIRSARDSLRAYLYQRMERLAALLGGQCEWSNAYPSWNFQPDSRLRQIAARAFQTAYGSEPAYLTVHAGLEVGYLLNSRPDVDAISIGPDCRDFHSPTESVQISSVKNFYSYFCLLLALLQ